MYRVFGALAVLLAAGVLMVASSERPAQGQTPAQGGGQPVLPQAPTLVTLTGVFTDPAPAWAPSNFRYVATTTLDLDEGIVLFNGNGTPFAPEFFNIVIELRLISTGDFYFLELPRPAPNTNTGTLALYVPQSGRYDLKIYARHRWSVAVSQPEVPFTLAGSATVDLSGPPGNFALGFLRAPAGGWRVELVASETLDIPDERAPEGYVRAGFYVGDGISQDEFSGRTDLFRGDKSSMTAERPSWRLQGPLTTSVRPASEFTVFLMVHAHCSNWRLRLTPLLDAAPAPLPALPATPELCKGPGASPSPTASPSPSPIPTSTSRPTSTPGFITTTPSPSPTPPGFITTPPTPVPSPPGFVTTAPSPGPTATPSPSPRPSPSGTPSPRPTVTPSPTPLPMPAATAVPLMPGPCDPPSALQPPALLTGTGTSSSAGMLQLQRGAVQVSARATRMPLADDGDGGFRVELHPVCVRWQWAVRLAVVACGAGPQL